MGVARQFWLVVVPLIVGLSAAGLLTLAFFFPDDLFQVGSGGFIVTAIVAVVALGVLVWRSAAFDGRFVGGRDPEQER